MNKVVSTKLWVLCQNRSIPKRNSHEISIFLNDTHQLSLLQNTLTRIKSWHHKTIIAAINAILHFMFFCCLTKVFLCYLNPPFHFPVNFGEIKYRLPNWLNTNPRKWSDFYHILYDYRFNENLDIQFHFTSKE